MEVNPKQCRAAWAILACSLLVVLATSSMLAYKLETGAHPAPAPTDTGCDDGFPRVDWQWWQQRNPDIVAWISIPGTKVNMPVVQASREDPTFYLYHDVFREPNFTGCPYLDPACMVDSLGKPGRCLVVTGHNMGWNQEVFGDLENYLDQSWGEGRLEVLLQTPVRKHRAQVLGARVIRGNEPAKRVEFSSLEDHRTWLLEQLQLADVGYGSPKGDGCTLLLATCSYFKWTDDERTLVFAQ